MYIFGASGQGRVIVDLIDSHEPIHGIFDDNTAIKDLLGYPVLGKIPPDFTFDQKLVVAIGDNRIRKRIVEGLTREVEFAKIVHHTAFVSGRASIDEGTVVMEGAIIKVCCAVGRHVIVNTGASMDHDCVVGDYVHLAPQVTLCGGVTVAEGTLLGANAVVLPGIRIGAWCTIAGGSTVTRNVPDGATWIGSKLS